MGRAERRMQARQERKMISVKDAKDLIHANAKAASHEAWLRSVDDCVTLCTTSLLLVLHDKFGFGRKRLERCYCEMAAVLDAMNDKRVSAEDIHEAMSVEVFDGEKDIYKCLETAYRKFKENRGKS